MANENLALQAWARQESFDSIPDLNNVHQGALREFERAISRDDKKYILTLYRSEIRNLSKTRRKLKNPINKRTGKPLKPTTLKQYQSSIATHERNVRNYKCAIRLLIFYNYIEAHKIRARWVRKLKAQHQFLDFYEGLTADERKFVEAYRGNDVQAVMATGHWKGYKAIRLAGRDYLSRHQIRSALKTKRLNQQPLCRLIIGGGQGEGKRFKCGGRKQKGNLVNLVSYYGDIYRRLCERIDSIEDVYGGTHRNIGNDHRARRAFNVHHELFMEVHGHHGPLVLAESEPDWDAIRRLRKEITKAERDVRTSTRALSRLVKCWPEIPSKHADYGYKTASQC